VCLHSALPQPPYYFPIRSGRYSVAPDLKPLGTDFGGSVLDQLHFQFDRRWQAFRVEKLAARAECLEKYAGALHLSQETRSAVVEWMVRTLCREHPNLFRLNDETLSCVLSQERLRFDAQWQLVKADPAASPPYSDALDALASQIQEDFAVVQAGGDGSDEIAAIHVCLPSRWAPREKLGLAFPGVHAPVPHFERISAAAPQMVRIMTERGPLVRFGWSVETDERLNHHPQPPPGASEAAWNSRVVDPSADEPFYLRVERQVLVSFPRHRASLFLIRVHHTPSSVILGCTERRLALLSALETMSPETRAYKGMQQMMEELLRLLRTA
jgi:hypothetical protein